MLSIALTGDGTSPGGVGERSIPCDMRHVVHVLLLSPKRANDIARGGLGHALVRLRDLQLHHGSVCVPLHPVRKSRVCG